jgi:hypothetical protein
VQNRQKKIDVNTNLVAQQTHLIMKILGVEAFSLDVAFVGESVIRKQNKEFRCAAVYMYDTRGAVQRNSLIDGMQIERAMLH